MTSSSEKTFSQAPSPPVPVPLSGPLQDALAEALPRLYGVQPDPLVRELDRRLNGRPGTGELEAVLSGTADGGGDSRRRPPRATSDALERSGLAQECKRRHRSAAPPLPAQPPGGGLAPVATVKLQTLLAELEQTGPGRLAETIADDAQNGAVRPAVPPRADQQQRRPWQGLLKQSLRPCCGGPGTGKTATVVQMWPAGSQPQAPLRVSTLILPATGKAAATAQQAIDSPLRSLPETLRASCWAFPCTTLHRLLESRGNSLRRSRQHPLLGFWW